MTLPLTRENRGAVALWTVQRPQARNAINAQLAEALERAVDDAEQDRRTRAIVIAAAGDRAFVAGADLKYLRDASPEARRGLDDRMRRVLDRFEALPVPIVAAIAGAVMGGGCELALACDIRVGGTNARFAFRHAAMGVTPGWGGLSRLTTVVSRSAAARLLFSAAPVDAEEALRLGLLDELAPEPVGRALALATQISEVAPHSVAELKRLLWRCYREGPLPAEERAAFERRAASPDHTEALTAFFEKRPPRFPPRS